MIKKVLIKFSEISLKGKNRNFFINKLVGNIVKSANRQNLEIIRYFKHRNSIIFEFKTNNEEIIKNCLNCVFGIKYFCIIEEFKKDMDLVFNYCQKFLEEIKEKEKINQKNSNKDLEQKKKIKICFKTKRSDKAFKLKSPQINAKLAEFAQKFDFELDYKNSKNVIYTQIGLKSIIMFYKRFNGLSGLPVGTSGRALVLLSGGFDSPIASYLILKRGMRVDFLHFHNLTNNQLVLESKINDIAKRICDFSFKSHLYLIPYSFYEFETIGKIKPRYDLIFFKHYIFKMAEFIAKKYEYDAIVCGDNLNQVASQTIENLKCCSYNIKTPILRPLLCFDKEEIIDFAKKIKTYDFSCLEYKDCCSILSKNPLTQTKLDKFEEVLNSSKIDNLIKKSFDKIEKFLIK